MLASPKDFLGVGWKFPVQADSNQMIMMSKYEEDIKEAIWIILKTSKGERIMHPDFGCGINNFVFQNMSSATIVQIEQTVRDALTLWEPRITLIKVTVSADTAGDGRLLIGIEYLVNATNNRFNLVYPFYLREGG